MNITSRQFDAAQQHRWLQAAYYHEDVVETMLGNPDIADDDNITTPRTSAAVPMDYPDALIGGNHAIHVSPETEISKRAHTSRPGVADTDQLVTYPPATSEFLVEIFH
ncbi:hypothetical protein BS329_09730 [Amycolatopsis coloradensis]|uniref:Uncharacterized protein n=1 Tax=Amycolatopsis coloradensis TaxID=76021 RepID=A0A1R0KVX7_9PSEU|nr:hypothetical protein [Amycolatopsis coloradensis]OLZ53102.1 hypothetical protein BS329_09730 [Amycolatopsis coloradensis]